MAKQPGSSLDAAPKERVFCAIRFAQVLSPLCLFTVVQMEPMLQDPCVLRHIRRPRKTLVLISLKSSWDVVAKLS